MKMKKIIAIMLCAFTVFALTARGNGSFIVDSNNNITTVTAEKASECGAMGYVTIADGEKLSVKSELGDKGQITIRALDDGGAGKVVFEESFSGTGDEYFNLPAGDYMLGFTAHKKVSGSMTVTSVADNSQ